MAFVSSSPITVVAKLELEKHIKDAQSQQNNRKSNLKVQCCIIQFGTQIRILERSEYQRAYKLERKVSWETSEKLVEMG